MDQPEIAYVEMLMRKYARLTGLDPSDPHPRRYLWTDAFAVCTYLELFRQTQVPQWRDLALRLIDQVHHTLGQFRPDDPRRGWISGASDEQGEKHPTAGGLRIGKSLPERRPEDPFDDRQEWDRDGQYYHYLTKWMHALGRVGQVTGDHHYIAWARELAKVAHARFVYTHRVGGRKSMYWKMSTDLTRPLVSSMGQHDPLDGLVTYLELQAISDGPFAGAGPDLSAEIADITEICRGMTLVTDDPLGIGGLLTDAARIGQLMIRGTGGYSALLESVLQAARPGLEAFTGSETLWRPAEYRLAFREFGLAIGLQGVGLLQQVVQKHPDEFQKPADLTDRIRDLLRFVSLAEGIKAFWRVDEHQKSRTWIENREISMVMLATSIAPDVFLSI